MDWKAHLLQFETDEMKLAFYNGASDERLSALSQQFQLLELPLQMVELYKQSDGVTQLYSGIDIGYFIWPIERIIESNLFFRNSADFKELYMSFDQLVFFADAGNGDQFAFCTVGRTDIFAWNHEDDSRNWVAPNISKFTEWWLTGVITV